MIKVKKKNVITILYLVYLVLLICFIFSNSLSDKEASAGKSLAVLEIVNNVAEAVGLPFRFSHVFVRKMGHFLEFFVLGASLFGFAALLKKVNLKNCVYCAFVACLVAMGDETIQYFCERGSMLLDVWLDFASAVVGILISYSIYHFVSIKRNTVKF
ncbi:MAG: VanZ family protein [Clostridia bacterium]|nr:VanZ family protein [Clostridia bacterium]